MIPKIIHYSWFSNDPMPQKVLDFIAGWKRLMPDYEYRLWDGEALKAIDYPFAQEAAAVKKWAFAADVVRCYAVYHYGGIWLDTDVEVRKPFDPYLNDRFFIGRENAVERHTDWDCRLMLRLGSHCFGAEPKHPFAKMCLDYYEGRHFVTSTTTSLPERLRYDMHLLPDIQATIATEFGYLGCVLDVEKEEVIEEGIHIYPPHLFEFPGYHPAENSVCFHHALGSWHPSDGLDHSVFMRTQKMGLVRKLYTFLNRQLAKRRLIMKVFSV